MWSVMWSGWVTKYAYGFMGLGTTLLSFCNRIRVCISYWRLVSIVTIFCKHEWRTLSVSYDFQGRHELFPCRPVKHGCPPTPSLS